MIELLKFELYKIFSRKRIFAALLLFALLYFLSEFPGFVRVSARDAPLPLEATSFLRLALIVLVPQIYLVFVLAGHMRQDFTVCSVYIFTRANRRKRWFAGKCVQLLFFAALYYLCQLAVLFCIGRFWGRLAVFDVGALFYILAGEFLLLTLCAFVPVLAVNILALKTGINYAFLTVVALTAFFTAFTLVFKDSILLKFIPAAQCMLLWHDSEKLLFYRDFAGGCLPGFTLGFSLLYVLSITAAAVLIGLRIIENLEIIGFEQEG